MIVAQIPKRISKWRLSTEVIPMYRALLRWAGTNRLIGETEIITTATSLLQNWDKPSAHAFITQLHESPGHLTTNTLSPLLSIAKRYRPDAHMLLEGWENQLLSLSDLALVGIYLKQMTGARLRNFCERLDGQIRKHTGNWPIEGVLSLLEGMARVHYKFQFSETAYQMLFQAVKTKDLSIHQRVQMVYFATKSTLSIQSLAQLLTDQHPFILTHAQVLIARERAYIVYAYSLFPLECSDAVISSIIKNIEVATLTVLDFVFILNGLSRFPVAEDTYLFQHAEQLILTSNQLPESKLALTIHAFAKRNKGSTQLFRYFQERYHAASLSPLHKAQILYSFLRSPNTDADFKSHLITLVPTTLAKQDLPEKLREALQYWAKS